VEVRRDIFCEIIRYDYPALLSHCSHRWSFLDFSWSYTDLGTLVDQDTLITMGRNRFTHALAEGDKKAIYFFPES
jgi:hypothetical protein